MSELFFKFICPKQGCLQTKWRQYKLHVARHGYLIPETHNNNELWSLMTKHCRVSHMAAYVASWQLIVSSITRKNAEDYMAVGCVLVQAILKNVSG